MSRPDGPDQRREAPDGRLEPRALPDVPAHGATVFTLCASGTVGLWLKT
jgi:hypothetical protein